MTRKNLQTALSSEQMTLDMAIAFLDDAHHDKMIPLLQQLIELQVHNRQNCTQDWAYCKPTECIRRMFTHHRPIGSHSCYWRADCPT